MSTELTALSAHNVDMFYDGSRALTSINLDIPSHRVMAFIGPSGCGKSTLLRCYNRMNDTIRGARVEGRILLEGKEIHTELDVVELRRRVGMVFQKPNLFPKSIYDNVAYGPRIAGIGAKSELDRRVEEAIRASALWNEVKDRLRKPALSLSGGQQQRLCIARALAVEPDILLMDEPTSALDPIATQAVEALMKRLAERYTLVVVTHNMHQALRVSDYTAFFYMGKLIEAGPTRQLFDEPLEDRTRDYVHGAFG